MQVPVSYFMTNIIALYVIFWYGMGSRTPDWGRSQTRRPLSILQPFVNIPTFADVSLYSSDLPSRG